MLSGARRVKEADALDITHYIRDPGNSHRFHKLMQIWGAPVSLWKREREKHEIPERLAHPDATAFLRVRVSHSKRRCSKTSVFSKSESVRLESDEHGDGRTIAAG
jgi:hypothetical protein